MLTILIPFFFGPSSLIFIDLVSKEISVKIILYFFQQLRILFLPRVWRFYFSFSDILAHNLLNFHHLINCNVLELLNLLL